MGSGELGRGGGGVWIGSVRRPITAAVSSARAGTTGGADSSRPLSRGASGQRGAGPDITGSRVTGTVTGQSVIYDGRRLPAARTATTAAPVAQPRAIAATTAGRF